MLNNFARSYNHEVMELGHELKLSNPKAHYTVVSQSAALGISEGENSRKAE